MRHRFHSICPYFAMFPESFAEKWIGLLTHKNDVVLDPFCGRGTTPFQAVLMGRQAIGCDINPAAYCITKAKTNAPPLRSVLRRMTFLQASYRPREWEHPRKRTPIFFRYAYHSETLRQILYLRASLNWQSSNTDAMIAALVLGSLHGESVKSRFYFSNQMPRTISTKPAYSIRFWMTRKMKAPERNVFEILRNRSGFRYESDVPQHNASVYMSDMRELPRLLPHARPKIRCVITSPPYLNVTNFEEDQWLRLWFLGGPPHPTYGVVSRDDRHERKEKYWDMIADFWRVMGNVLAPKAHVVIRLGAKGMFPDELKRGMCGTSVFSRRRVRLIRSEVSEIKGRQTDSFRPGSQGCLFEVDCCFSMQ